MAQRLFPGSGGLTISTKPYPVTPHLRLKNQRKPSCGGSEGEHQAASPEGNYMRPDILITLTERVAQPRHHCRGTRLAQAPSDVDRARMGGSSVRYSNGQDSVFKQAQSDTSTSHLQKTVKKNVM